MRSVQDTGRAGDIDAMSPRRGTFLPARTGPSLMGACALACAASFAFAADTPGSKDHPLVGRYEGSNIVFYKHSDYDEAALLKAPHDYSALLDANRLSDRSGPEWLKAEGAITEIRYDIPKGRSSLEVMHNYEQALQTNGFAPMFSCADQGCFKGKLQDPYLLGQQIDKTNGISTAYFDHARYLLASRDGPGGPVYASILTGEDKDRVTGFVTVVEPKGIESGKVVFKNAADMQAAIDQAGTVDLYGILFDTGQDRLKPESRPTLDEIAKLLIAKPDLRLKIVGHTDNVGSADYNMSLSRRRAASVVAALAQNYGIAAERLQFSGAGLTTPVAPNDTEDGRARNRRVELKAE